MCVAEAMARCAKGGGFGITCVGMHKVCVLTSAALKTVSTSKRSTVPGMAI